MTVEVKTLLKGPVTIAYKREGRKWYATALEFDLVGIGSSRTKAFVEVTQLVEEYISACLQEKGRTLFTFPSEAEEWNNDDKEWFTVTISLRVTERRSKNVPRSLNLSELRRFRSNIGEIGLVPAHI